MKKSQSSTEFMIFVGIAIVILMSYFVIAHNYLNLTYKQRDIISGQDLAKQIANEVNLASRVEDNYERTFKLPFKIGDKDYGIYIQNREIVVIIDELDYVEMLTTSIGDERRDFSPGSMILVSKYNGQVNVIEQEGAI